MKDKSNKNNSKYLLVIILVLLTIFLLYKGITPSQFDILGLLAFPFLFYVGFLIMNKKQIPRYFGFILIIISATAFIIDIVSVIKTYILGG